MSEAAIERDFAFDHAGEILGATTSTGHCAAELLPPTSASPKLTAGVRRCGVYIMSDNVGVCE